MSFEANRGQTDAQVRYFARGPGYGLFLTATEAVFTLQSPGSPAEGQGRKREAHDTAVLRMSLAGAREPGRIEGLEPQQAGSHYFRGSDSKEWLPDVPRFGKVHYSSVYPGIDLVYYGNQHQLEYDFIVSPGADAGQIGLQFEGTRGRDLDEAGNLILTTPLGALKQDKPIAYQEIGGRKRLVDARYRLDGEKVAIAVGAYDHTRPLIIDPVLSYSTYLGGGSDDLAEAIAVDGAGNTYLAGLTSSTNFPMRSALQGTSAGGGSDVFVAKLNAAGTSLLYSTYLGGAGEDVALAIAVDGSGNAYVAGYTDSANFPTKQPLQPMLQSAPGYMNGFVTKLNSSGSGLVYSTYLGVTDDIAHAIVVDSDGSAYVAGDTKGGFVFLGGPLQPDFGGGQHDGVLIKLNPAGNDITWGTYLGGSDFDSATGLAIDGAGNVHVSGYTVSFDFPVVTPAMGYKGGSDAFLASFSRGGTASYSTYFGGTGSEYANDVAVDRAGNVYLAGESNSVDFPITTASSPHPGGSGFVAKINPNHAVVYSTAIGGNNTSEILGVDVDAAGYAYVAGSTKSQDFPTASPWQASFGGVQDGFVAKLNATGTDMLWASFLGGAQDDRLFDLAVDSTGKVHVAGRTYGNFPLVSAMQGTHGGARDAVVSLVTGATPTSPRYRRNDVQDDGFADVLWHDDAGGDLWLWSRTHPTLFRILGARYEGWSIAGTGDFNGDHRADIVWRNRQNGANELWRSSNRSNAQALTGITNLDWQIAGVGDFDADGFSDLLWRNVVAGTNALWPRASYASRRNITPLAPPWKVAGIGDFDGDRKDDILWRNPATGANVIWKAAASTNVLPVSNVATSWQVAAIGDFNGDRKADVFWRNSVTAASSIWRSANSATRQAVTQTSATWRLASAADFNGDGTDDLMWQNPDTGTVVVWSSANSGTRYSVSQMTWKAVP
ncbi:hypothetical protein ASD14_14850 [Lysobacter sp. Root494]|nr:hypothetical protein ASD14_14850 [Lysobacter sp. Root494]